MHFNLVTIVNLVALCVSTVNALALPTLNTRAAPAGTTVSQTGQKTNGVFKAKEPSLNFELSASEAQQRRGITAPSTTQLEDRQVTAAVVTIVIAVAIVSFVGEAAATEVIVQATDSAVDSIKALVSDLKQWNEARENFMRATTAEMYAKNPDPAKYPASICYNKAYMVRNPAGVLGMVSAQFKLGSVLHTDYDCLYMSANNQFQTQDDGGYINLAYTYDGSRCAFDRATGDLACKA